MTDDELIGLLEALPLRRLHALARGRVHRHFRLGRHRLIEVLLALPSGARSVLEAEVFEHSHTPRRDTSFEHQHSAQRDSSFEHQHTLQRDTSFELQHSPQRDSSFEHQHSAKRDSSTASKKLQKHLSSPKIKGRPSRTISEAPITVAGLLDGLGVPATQDFQPDTWQQNAVTQLATTDVIVSVPTGSGKTYVAVEATKHALEQEQTVIYTSPLKALSNTKFMEFSQLFGEEQVGILTGDRRDNAQAPLLIMTTEILRNLLYDAASGEVDVRLNTLGLVILDESQYLADPERGVVWEETIIFCPTQARLLLLSASIGNPQDLSAWLTSIRPDPCHLIHHQNRSVPLRGGYLHPNGQLCPLFRTRDITKGQGYTFHPDAKRLSSQYEDETVGHRRRR